MEETNDEQLIAVSEDQQKKIETTINTRVKKLTMDVKEIKSKTNSMILNNSPHGVATISISLFIAAEKYLAVGDYKYAALYFVAGSFMYLIQNALNVLKIKLGDASLGDISKNNYIVRTVGELTGAYRKGK